MRTLPLCFAYGSNMDRAAMAMRCPGAAIVGPARLARHRLALMREGYATVVRDPRRTVHGILWDVPLSEMPALDRYESVASGLYVKRRQPVMTAAGVRTALVYLGCNAGPGTARPGYLAGVLAAARDVGLPEEALNDIRSLAPRAGGSVPTTSPADRLSVRPTRATPRDPPRPTSRPGWSWTP